MRKVKKNDKEIELLENEFKQTAFIDPKFGYDSLYKYKAYYISDGKNLDRCGVIKLSANLVPKKLYSQKYETINLKCYSNTAGYFILENISFHAGKNFVNKYEPLIYFKNAADEKYTIMEYDYIYETSEVDEVTIIYSTLEKPGDSFNLYNIYINQDGKTKYTIENVSSYDYLPEFENLLIYIFDKSRKNKNEYEFYLFDYKTGNNTYLGKQDTIHMYGGMSELNKVISNVKKSKREIVDKEKVYFYFSTDSSIGFSAFFEYLKIADGLEKIENIFPWDVTESYVAWFNKNRTEDIQFVCYMLLKLNIAGLKICDFEIKKIAKCIDFDNGIYEFYIKNKFTDSYEAIAQIIKLLKNKLSKTDTELVQFLCYEYGKFSTEPLDSKMDPYRIQAKIQHPEGLEKSKLQAYDKELRSLYEKALMNDDSKVKWKSEFQLFKLVKMHFEDSIYQYRTSWLGLQSLDIYIEGQKIGIEFQGEQHYMPIEVFGGREAFKTTQERDKRKKLLCKENGVKLIEWKYDYPINIFNLVTQLSLVGVSLNIELKEV